MTGLQISTDQSLIDFHFVYQSLSKQTVWAKGISKETVMISIENSVFFGVYLNDQQIGFARVITDQATFAYLADVFITPEHIGKGFSKELINYIVNYSPLQGLRRWVLVTADAHGLYKPFGFKKPENPENYMEIRNTNVYKNT